VILWTHHEEWGSPSNTGSVLSVMLNHVQLWMKGYHDLEMQQLLCDDSTIPVLLWPTLSSSSAPSKSPIKGKDNDDEKNNDDKSSISSSAAAASSSPQYPKVLTTKHELQELVESCSKSDKNDNSSSHKRQIVLIAMEGTWRQARRLVAKFPKDVPRLSVTASASSASWPIQEDDEEVDKPKRRKPQSILHPLRRQNHHGDPHSYSDNSNMCTAEAAVAALQLLGMSVQDSNQVLDAVRLKVDRTRRYQGKPLRPPR
jgi:DTW domain-containing protein YfiP